MGNQLDQVLIEEMETGISSSGTVAGRQGGGSEMINYNES
jgi:hypothetical protein